MKNVSVVILVLLCSVIICSLCFGPCFAQDASGKMVLFLPLENLTQTPQIESKVTDILAEELVKTQEFRIYHPAQIEKMLSQREEFEKKLPLKQTALKLGNKLGAQFAIYGAVTKYDGYPPYAIGLTIEMVDLKTGQVVFSKYFEDYGFAPEKETQFEAFFGIKHKQVDRISNSEFIHNACAKLVNTLL